MILGSPPSTPSTSGEINAGVVTFRPLDSNRCRLDIEMDYVAEGLIEAIGSALRWDTRSVKADLARFKGRIESQGRENGSSSVGKGSHSGKEDQPGVDTSNQ